MNSFRPSPRHLGASRTPSNSNSNTHTHHPFHASRASLFLPASNQKPPFDTTLPPLLDCPPALPSLHFSRRNHGLNPLPPYHNNRCSMAQPLQPLAPVPSPSQPSVVPPSKNSSYIDGLPSRLQAPNQDNLSRLLSVNSSTSPSEPSSDVPCRSCLQPPTSLPAEKPQSSANPNSEKSYEAVYNEAGFAAYSAPTFDPHSANSLDNQKQRPNPRFMQPQKNTTEKHQVESFKPSQNAASQPSSSEQENQVVCKVICRSEMEKPALSVSDTQPKCFKQSEMKEGSLDSLPPRDAHEQCREKNHADKHEDLGHSWKEQLQMASPPQDDRKAATSRFVSTTQEIQSKLQEKSKAKEPNPFRVIDTETKDYVTPIELKDLEPEKQNESEESFLSLSFEMLRTFYIEQKKGMPVKDRHLVFSYAETLRAHDAIGDYYMDKVDQQCTQLVLDARIPYVRDSTVVRLIDESEEDSKRKQEVKLEHQLAVERLQNNEEPAKRRSNLPKDGIVVLKKWITEHYDHPYPSEEEKAEMSRVTNIHVHQISHWFINYRKRVWKPNLPGNHPVHITEGTKQQRKRSKGHITTSEENDENDT